MSGVGLGAVSGDARAASQRPTPHPRRPVYGFRRLQEWLDLQRDLADPHLCHDCRVDVAPMDFLGRPKPGWHWYMVKAAVWKAAKTRDVRYLCVLCLEARLGRLLRGRDLTPYPINDPFSFDAPELAEVKWARVEHLERMASLR